MEWVAKLLPEIWLSVNILLFMSFLNFKSKDDFYSLYNLFNFSLFILVFSVLFQFYLLSTNNLSLESNLDLANLDLSIGNLIIYSNGFFELISKLFISIISVFISVSFYLYFKKGKEDFLHRYFKPDLLCVYLTIILGSFVLVSSNDFLTFLIGFELIAIPSYFAIAMDNRRAESLEGSMKYFLIGSLSTISLILSILIFYIYSGSLVFSSNFGMFDYFGVKLAFVIFIMGLLIKLAAFPLSFWIQDAYAGSRTPYLLVISTIPKLAVLFAFIKVILMVPYLNLGTFLFVFSLFSMVMGTFFALTNNDIRKILAFSTITNIGYILIPFSSLQGNLVNNSQALSVVYFYVLQYVLATILFISVLIYLEEKYDTMDLENLKGALSNNPLLSVFMIVSLVTMAGLPPTSGFIAKFLLFAYSYSISPFLVWVGIITSVISLYFYYRIAQELYVKNEKSEKIEVGFLNVFSNSVLSLMIVFMGFFPSLFLNIIYFAIISVFVK